MKKQLLLAAVVTVLGAALPASASSHREAFGTMNDPCIDTTDIYAWVTPGAHDKLYLIASLAGLHEPGQGNHQTRLCDDVLYEFHISRGNGLLDDELTYQIKFQNTPATPVDETDLTLPPGGGKELLVQLSGSQQFYNVFRRVKGQPRVRIGTHLPVTPPNVGPNTDRIAYGLGPFDPNDPAHHNVALYDDGFAASFIRSLGNNGSEGRAWVGTRDDAFYLDEKAIFDIINLAGVLGRNGPAEDVFAGFNVNTIALEIPTSKLTGTGQPPAHNGTPGDDTTLAVWFSASRRKVKTISADGEPTYAGPWVQVSRQALPLFNAGLIGAQDQNKYLRTTPLTDVENFAGYILNPVLVRDVEFLGIYDALGVPQATIDALKSGRVDILDAVNLTNFPTPGAHNVPIAPGFTGDVIRVDMAIDSAFPNGRPIPGGAAPNQEQADVSDVLLTVILSGGAIPLGDGVNANDKDYLTQFPWLALPHQGLFEGHGAPAP
jgi:hypothetical protein